MASYIGWFKHANCYSLLNKTIKHKELLDCLDIRKGIEHTNNEYVIVI